MKKMNIKWLLGILIIVLVALFFVFDLQTYFSLSQLKEQKQALSELFANRPVLTMAGFFLIYVALTALALPAAAILTLAGGAVFGFWKGLILVSFASTIGASIAFLLTRYLFRGAYSFKTDYLFLGKSAWHVGGHCSLCECRDSTCKN